MTEFVRLRGFNALDKELSKLPVRVQRKIGVAALRRGARPMVKSMRAKVPVKTRNLQKSIGVKALPPKSKALRLLIGPRVGKKAKNDGFYGIFFERGTKHMAAKPFMRPAFDETKNEALRIIGEEVWSGIVKELKSCRCDD